MAKVSIEQPIPKTSTVKMLRLPRGRLARVVDGWSNGCGNEIDIEILPAGFKVTIEQD